MAPSLSTSKWPSRYSVDKGMWNDAGRISAFIFPTIVVNAIVAAVTSSLIFFHLKLSFERISSWIGLTVFLFLVFIFLEFNLLTKIAVTFFNSFYAPPEGINSRRLIINRLLGVPPTPILLNSMLHYPFVVINIANVDDGKFKLETEPIHWLGGPTILIIFDGTGIYVERGNQFSRTLGPGIAFLDRYERVREIIDLRPQTMSSGLQNSRRSISGRTKDGIKIEFNIEIKFHILRPESEHLDELGGSEGESVNKSALGLEAQKILDTPKPIYPGDLEAIKKAVERTAVRFRYKDSNYSEAKWREGVWGRVSGKLAGYITQYYLDELLQFDNLIRESASIKDDTKNVRVIKASQLLSEAELKRVCQDLDATLKTDFGVTLSDLRIIDLNLPPEVHQQYLEVVKTENEARIKRGEGKSAIEMISKGERKRAQAQRDLIDALADGLNNVDPQNFTDSILLSLEGILHKSLQDTAIPSVIAKDNFATLEQLRDFLKKSEGDSKIN